MALPLRTAAALQGRVGVAQEVRDLLSGIEVEAERLRDELLRHDSSWVPALEQERVRVIAALATFLDDRMHGGLPRALRRINAILSDERTRLGLSRSWLRISGRAARLLQRRDALAAFSACLERLTRGSALRWHVADLVTRWNLEPSRVSLLSAPIIRARQAHLEREIERLHLRLRTASTASTSGSATSLPEAVSLEDVAMARSLLPSCTFAPAILDQRRLLRRIGDAQLVAWLGERIDGPLDMTEETVQDAGTEWPLPLAREILRRCADGHGTGGDDLDARSLLLLDAAQRRPWPSHPVPIVSEGLGQPWEQGLFVRPLFGDYVLIQEQIPAPIRLVQSRVRPKDEAEATVYGVRPVSLPFATWGRSLFSEPDSSVTSLWAVQKRPKIAVLAQIDALAWLGRVICPGRLEPTRRDGPDVITLRNASCFLEDVVRLQATPTAVQTRRFGGLIVRDVLVPVEDHGRAELHTASTSGQDGPLESERRFLRLATARLQGLIPRPIGESEDGQGFLYAPYVARRISHSAVLDRIRLDNPRLLAGAAARLWARLSGDEVRLALGLYHPDAMAFRCVPALPTQSGGHWARLECVVASAPCGCALGEQYPRFEELDPIRLPRLGRVPLARVLASLGTASVSSEGRMVLLCIADLLTRRVIRVPDGNVRNMFEHLIDRVHGEPDAFHDADLVVRIIQAVCGPDEGVVATARFFEQY
jgi:hypothetical protein